MGITTIVSRAVRIAFLNSKGGVGKTTTAVNTAVALAELGNRILLVDMDAQSHVGSHLGIKPVFSQSVDSVLQSKTGRLEQAVQGTAYENLDVVVSTGDLDDVEKLLIMRNQPLDALWKAMARVTGYDYILVDCAPNLGTLTRNAMRACEFLVIPTDLDSFSVEGMDRLGNRITEIQEDFGTKCANVLGVLITKYDLRQGIENRWNSNVLDEAFGGEEVFFARRIRVDERCKRAKRQHHSVLDEKESRAAADYRALAQELAKRVVAQAS